MVIKEKTGEEGTCGGFAKEFQVVGGVVWEDEGLEGFGGLSDNLLVGKAHVVEEGFDADALMQGVLVPDTEHAVAPDDDEAVSDLWGE